VRAGIIQSSYIPWRGYFDFISSVDVFVLFDDVAFGSKGSWRHRNALKFGAETRWLTVPVKAKPGTPIDEVETAGDDWIASHRGLLRESLGKAPHVKDALALWEGSLGGTLSQMNQRFAAAACRYLGVSTRLVDARSLGAKGAKTERLIDLLRKLGADVYLSGPTAKDYIDPADFRRAGIKLEYKTYDYEPYPQLGTGFMGNVSILDMIANCGKDSARFLRSRAPDEVAA
jgi:hypothetical protein